MDDWVLRAMKRWPNVPALFGWLGLDRKGRWLLQGEIISHPRIVSAINRNYAADEHGRWFFQNGPQRGFIRLEYAPFVLWRPAGGSTFTTHTDLPVERPTAAYLDESGTILLHTEHGPGAIAGDELGWVLERLTVDDAPIGEQQIADALSLSSGTPTRIAFDLCNIKLPVQRLDAAAAPARLNYVRDPQPRSGEMISSGAQD